MSELTSGAAWNYYKSAKMVFNNKVIEAGKRVSTGYTIINGLNDWYSQEAALEAYAARLEYWQAGEDWEDIAKEEQFDKESKEQG